MTSVNPSEDDPDVEDGEITDDDEASEPTPIEPVVPNPVTAGAQPTIPVIPKGPPGSVSDSESIRDAGELQFKEQRSSDPERSDDKDRFSDGRERDRGRKANRKNRGARDDKNHRRMTEAERSILHLRKREKMQRQREKWDKHHRKDVDPLGMDFSDDDFAKNIEKTLATILNKKEKEVAGLSGEETKDDDEKRGKKRKNQNRDKTKNKHKRMVVDSPFAEDIDDSEMLNMRSGSPNAEMRLNPYPMEHRGSEEESLHSGNSEDEREERAKRRMNKNRRKKEIKREKKERDQRRNNSTKREAHIKLLQQGQEDGEKVCVFYLQGKCQKHDCPYSHEVCPPMKLELCKFYLMDCCAKGENCSYMHSEFPCKFYHTGLNCENGKDCKFAHGKPLSQGLKQILFKHIETAPRDILQGFPRLTRDEALNLINQTQKNMHDQLNTTNGSEPASTTTTSTSPQQGLGMYRETSATERSGSPEEFPGGIPSLFDISVPVPRELAEGLDFESPKSSKQKNNRSCWQQDEDSGYLAKNFNNFGTDLDMRFISNGDIDMRTLPPIQSSTSTTINKDSEGDDSVSQGDVDIRNFTKDVDHRTSFARNMDIDIRQRPSEDPETSQNGNSKESDYKFELPAAARDLLARITANQKDSPADASIESKNQNYAKPDAYEEQNINWYSDDDDDDRLAINIEEEEIQRREREDSTSENQEEPEKSSFFSPPRINTQTVDIVNKLGDLSKFDISAEVTKLLSSMSQKNILAAPAETATVASTEFTTSPRPESGFSPRGPMLTDPRISKQGARQDPRQQDPRLNDSRRPRQSSTETKEKKSDKISIYEQGGLDMKRAALEIERDFKNSDTDLRNMPLPFKGMQNYTPATEIDGSINSHPPMVWKLVIVEVPRPDYSGLKLNMSDAQKTGDPRIRKFFRLSIDEKDSPASPKASPKQSSSSGGVRIDPRLRKIEEKPQELMLQDNVSLVQMNYNQQIGMLQSSQFYQSLTSHQKQMLNKELARVDKSGGGGLNDPVLNTILGTLNLLPQAPQQQIQAPLTGPNMHMGAATSILNNINKMNPMLQMGQPGLLGAAPGIPNMPHNIQSEFQMGFDPRGGPGLLGNAPAGAGFAPQFNMDQQPQFNIEQQPQFNMDQQFGMDQAQFGIDQAQFGMDQSQYGYNNDEYYNNYNEGNSSQGGHFRGGRGFNNNNRDSRRRGNRDGFRGRPNNRNFHKRGGNRDKGDRNDRERRGNRGHSPS
ncbi:unnamed protein product [Ceutorhynchus assimilis]|uniref:C3H1-type domain-containing protein n=1 Tax=Ceutorhynchus assimilis TaxID=467358 RepID=A0A9P0GKV9_9CUCU|nr:unnamed protein product [Ceutorhynchus assimilis]